MPFRDSFLRALKRSDTHSSTSASSTDSTPIPSVPQSGSATPIASIPASLPTTFSSPPTRTNTGFSSSSLSSNRLSLSKTLSSRFLSSRTKLTPTEKERKKIEEWREHDAKAWDMPPRKPNKHKSKAHQDILRTFELRFKDVRESWEERRGSVLSGVSPGQSRVGSIDQGVRKRSAAQGPLSREVSRDEGVAPPHSVGAVLA